MASNAREFDDPAFLERLRQGDEAAYRALIRRFHGRLTAVAASIIGSKAQAEEVVQDAWLAVYAGISRFEGRSSLTTWLFSIVLNRARTRIGRESRTVGLPAVLDGAAPGETVVPASAFKPDGHWAEAPTLWDDISPERIVAGRQLWDHVALVIDAMPAGQKAVITLRDLEGQDAETVCALLEISPENQRVLLHRARGRVRQAVDALLRVPAGRPEGRPAGRPEGRPAGRGGGSARGMGRAEAWWRQVVAWIGVWPIPARTMAISALR